MPESFVCGLHHIQIAIPSGKEAAAREFYRDVLGLTEVPVPASVAHLAAAWFERGTLRVHLGVDPDFHPAKKAHPAFLVTGLDQIVQRLERAGVSIVQADAVTGFKRCHIFDPFGNRIELIEAISENPSQA
jgi:catechol 2,3-dioxygenase-like lactoylglutathione lyase family enzyme